MRRMGIVGVCLLALLVAGLAVASGASAAAPEFKVCAKAEKSGKTYLGHYSNKNCEGPSFVETGGQKYERASWEKAKKKKFKGKSAKGAKQFFLIINPGESENEVKKEMEVGKVESELECEGGEKTEGEVTGPKTATWSSTFKKCRVKALYKNGKFEIQGPCETEGAKEGEIKTGPMEGTLAVLNAAKTTVGLRQAPKPGPSYAKISCIEGLVNDQPTGEALLEVKGNTNVANKDTEMIGKEGPDHGQSPYYEEEAHSEAEAFSYFDFGFCVTDEEEKGLNAEEAELACAIKLGGPPPPAPVSRIAHISGAKSATAPETEVFTSTDKGEAFLIES